MADEKQKQKKGLAAYGEHMKNHASSPRVLAELGTKMAGEYGSLTEKYIVLKIKWAEFYQNTCYDNESKKKRSEKTIESLWIISPEGTMHLRVKKQMQALEKMMNACKTSTIVANNEAKNQY